MRAVQYDEYGYSSVLHLVTDAPMPRRRQGKVLIEVHASSVNPVDAKFRAGWGGRLAGPRLPGAVPGADVAGVVVESDEGSAFKPGDRVMGLMDGFLGAWAEYVAMPEAALARIPEQLSFEQAGALPLVGLTAWQGFELAHLRPGERILIHAAAGGVGSLAVQLAKKVHGLYVIGTCSSRNVEFVKELGADQAIDYTKQDFAQVLKDRPVDAVFELMMGEQEARSLSVLKKSGTLVNFFPVFRIWPVVKGVLKGMLGLGPRYRVELASPNGAQLQQLAELVAEGKVTVHIQQVLPLDKAAKAQDLIATGHTRGKIIIKIRG